MGSPHFLLNFVILGDFYWKDSSLFSETSAELNELNRLL